MNKKVQTVQKILSVLLIAIIFITTGTTVFADSSKKTSSDIIQPSDVGVKAPEGETIKTSGEQIIGILQTVGVVLSIVILIIIGIKYMMGSAEEKAEYKKTFIPYVVGAALIFAASVFAQGIFDLVTSITGKA